MTPALALAACLAVSGARIHVGDLAAALPAFAAAPADAVLGYAPVPGAKRVFETAELVRLARQFHVSEEGLAALCVERRSASPDPARLAEAMRNALQDPAARIEILEASRYPVPEGTTVFPLAGVAERPVFVWNGYVEAEGGRFPVWARVKVTVRRRRVVALAALPVGHVVQASDVRVEELETGPSRAPVATSVEAVVGCIPRRSLAAGSVIAADALAPPLDVEKGEAVRVEVRGGAARLRLDARAESSGRRGDSVPLRNLESGKLFRGRVEAKGLVVVEVK